MGLPGARTGRAVGGGEVPHGLPFVDPTRDVAEPGIVGDASPRQYLGDRDGRSARGAQRCVEHGDELGRAALDVGAEGAHRLGRGGGGVGAVAQAVRDHDQRPLGGLMDHPGVAAGLLAVQREADRADSEGA